MKRIFSKNTYNGYHIISYSDEPNHGIVFGKTLSKKDEYGFIADEDDIPRCPNSGKVSTMFRPWGEFIIVPTLCQRCIWCYGNPQGEFDCLLLTKDKKIRPEALVVGER